MRMSIAISKVVRHNVIHVKKYVITGITGMMLTLSSTMQWKHKVLQDCVLLQRVYTAPIRVLKLYLHSLNVPLKIS